MEPEYLNLVRLLNEEKVEYVVLGGHAVIAHGYLRTTGDIDIFVNPTPENAEKIVLALEKYGFTNGEFEVSDFTLVPNYLSFSRYDGWIDLMTFTVGVTFEECYQNKIELEVQGVKIKFINLRELIKNKKTLGRPQDLNDLQNLENLE
ncbi:nucleotidyltransferase [Runella limosa]|uniref:nucleotidyltransferase n=1 Tax=Runella limosa TaxID=370978 RepID=UPI00068578F9|nr:nucleotidyltransferase [Runella limosa]